MSGVQLYLQPDEAKFLSMAVMRMLEDAIGMVNDNRNWTPEARKMAKDMKEAGTKLKIKLEKIGLDMSPIPPYNEGDELEFLTKPS